MHYGLIADNPQEEALLESNPAVRVLFDPFLPALQARSIITAGRLRIFEVMGNDSHDVEGLARVVGCDPEVLGLLLDLLVCAGYCAQENGHYQLSVPALATLLPDSPASLSAWIRHNRFHWDVIDAMEEVVRTGRGIDSHQLLDSADRWADYQEAMLETARSAAPLLASLIPVPEGAELLLDIGGSHGLYGALVCRAHPPMRSIVLDLPEAVECSTGLARSEGIDDVVEHQIGDAMIEDLGEELYDVILVANLVHHFTMEQNARLFSRIRSALMTGGTVAIWDFQPGDGDGVPDLLGSGLALFWRLSSTSRCHPIEEQVRWLESAGFDDIIVHPTPMPAQVLLTGRKS